MEYLSFKFQIFSEKIARCCATFQRRLGNRRLLETDSSMIIQVGESSISDC